MSLRQRMSPESMEILLFLKINKEYWDIDEVKAIYQQRMSAKSSLQGIIELLDESDEDESDEE